MTTTSKYLVVMYALSSIALSSVTAGITDITPGGTVPFGGSEYKVFTAQAITWADARAYVQANLPGWDLAASTSAVENAFIWGAVEGAWTADGNKPPPGQYWLGGYQDPPQTWNWVTGEAWSYANWAPGEPNGDLGWTGHLAIGRNGDWGWNDEGSAPGLITGFVVETLQASAPESGTFVVSLAVLLPIAAQGLRGLRTRKT